MTNNEAVTNSGDKNVNSNALNDAVVNDELAKVPGEEPKFGLQNVFDFLMHGDSMYNYKNDQRALEYDEDKYVREVQAMLKAGLNPRVMLQNGGTSLNTPELGQSSQKKSSEFMLMMLLNAVLGLGKGGAMRKIGFYS